MDSDQGRTLRRTTRRPNIVLGLMTLATAIAASGCAPTTYPASSLPAEMRASVTPGAERIPLGGLSGPWAQTDVIYPGDVLAVLVATGVEDEPPQPWLVRVADNGVAEIPVVGTIQVAGLRFPQAEAAIRNESVRRELYVNPTVSVGLNARHTRRVTVTGAVREEGVYDIPAVNANLLAALMRAKGLSDKAGLEVEIRQPTRPGVVHASYDGGPSAAPEITRINLAKIANGQAPNVSLQDGATITVLKRPLSTFQVIGLVRKPNQFEMEPDHEYRLLEAIALAGDRTLQIADKVHIIRRLPDQEEPVVIKASIRKAKSDGEANVILAPGDVVSVEETPSTFTVGAIRDFIRFGFSAGIPGL